ncbi:histidine kinase [uncultured Croceitalea sp.]|uniref:sensor histidine kinase n=1 Tax=uncultured Croceitalea sp. TaxID=1798908 RepID=UPI0033057486
MSFRNAKSILGFNDHLYVGTGIFLNTHAVMTIYYTGAILDVVFIDYLIKWFGEFLIILILWLVIRTLYLKLLAQYNGIKHLQKRLVIIPLFLIPYLVLSIAYLHFVQPFFDWQYPEYPEPIYAVQLLTGIFIFVVDVSFYEVLHLFVELKNNKINKEKNEKERVTSQLINLENQVSPHFLFNSLNTLIHLIDTDKERSKAFVHKLANVYKTTLRASEHNLVSVQEELDYIYAYTELLKERFGENINFEIKVHKSVKAKKVIPLSLQLIIENAVNQNVITRKKPLLVTIRTDSNYLMVKNNLQKKHIENSNLDVGIQNIRRRYALLSTKQVVIENGLEDFRIKLPLLDN